MLCLCLCHGDTGVLHLVATNCVVPGATDEVVGVGAEGYLSEKSVAVGGPFLAPYLADAVFWWL